MEQHQLSNYKHRHAKHDDERKKKAARFYNYEERKF